MATHRSFQLFVLLFKIITIAAVVVFILNKLLGDGLTKPAEFSSLGNRLVENLGQFHQNAASNGASDGDLTKTSSDQMIFSVQKSKQYKLWNWTETLSQLKDAVFVMIPLANAKHNPKLQSKFRVCVTSMSDLSSAHVVLFVAGDAESRTTAENVVSSLVKKNVQLHYVDIDTLGKGMDETIAKLKNHFSYSQKSYYAHTLFFLSTAIHRLAPPSLHRLIMLDADLKFNDDIQLLNNFFHHFSPSNILGIAHENQPVYRHVLSVYRQSHPDTRAGDPKPGGLPGFNSGVLLLDLDKMRKSERYNAVLDTDIVSTLAKKYSYQGHLGDQDFYSLLSFEYEDMFYVLPCGWNRQLCRWWFGKGYDDVFQQYFACDGKISVYHGNCDTPIPD